MLNDNEVNSFMALVVSLRKKSKIGLFETDDDILARINLDHGKELAADEIVLTLKSMIKTTDIAKHLYKWVELQNKARQVSKQEMKLHNSDIA